MKKIIIPALTLALFAASCGEKKEEKKNDESAPAKTEKIEVTEDTVKTVEENTAVTRNVELFPSDLSKVAFESILEMQNEEELKMAFTSNNISRGIGYMPEGMGTYMVTKIFADTENEVTVVWDDTTNASGISWIETSAEGGQWRTKLGIKVGTTMEEAAEINGAPLTFSGFEWDYQGAVYNTNGGKIKKHTIMFDMTFEEGKHENLMGDIELRSDMEKVKGAPIFVSSLKFSPGE